MYEDFDWGKLAGEIALGTLIGIAIGFTFKKSIKLLLVLLGFTAVILLLLEDIGVIAISWESVETIYETHVEEQGGLGQMFQQIVQWFSRSIPLGGSFVAGFFAGFKMG